MSAEGACRYTRASLPFYGSHVIHFTLDWGSVAEKLLSLPIHVLGYCCFG
jgi:hypothetical protein